MLKVRTGLLLAEFDKILYKKNELKKGLVNLHAEFRRDIKNLEIASLKYKTVSFQINYNTIRQYNALRLKIRSGLLSDTASKT